MNMIKTMQWNIGGGRVCQEEADPLLAESYCEDGLGEIIDVLLQEQPDIVTLQETHESEDIRQAEIIAVEADYNFWVNDTYDESHIQRGQRLGQAVLSRYPLSAHQFIPFTNPCLSKVDDKGVRRVSHDKGLTKCSIELPDRRKLLVETFHMTPFHFFDVELTSEAGSMALAELDSLLDDGQRLRLIQADFNIDAANVLSYFPALQARGFLEVVQAEPTSPKEKRLDHVVYAGMRAIRSTVRRDVRTDHYPVITDFRAA